MADALISVVLEQLASYVQEEVGLAVGVREEVQKLTTTLKIIQGVLADAERKQVRDDSVKAWLEELKNIFYTADDVLDEWHTISQQPQLQGDTHHSNKVLPNLFSPCFNFEHVVECYDISHRIQDITKNLDVLAQQRLQFGLNVIQTDVSLSEWQAMPLTSSIVNSSEIHGREDDKEIIISRLLGGFSRHEDVLPVVSIVGMGGSGKTTLAKLVFNDERVQNNFEKKMWVCVSEPFDLIRVAWAIIEQANGKAPEVNEWKAWHQHLCDSIKGKKFLLVLDDVRACNFHHWDPLKHSLDGGVLDSRIMVTMRDLGVAKTIGSSYIHNIPKLSNEDSWLLLRDIALRGRQEVAKSFEEIGKEIAAKCKGVPLTIKTLAGHLCSKDTKQEWNDILRSDLWEVDKTEQKFLPSLLLSYHLLPSNIKQCFIYCAIFPKDDVLIKDDLVKLWMAQGFLGSDETKELEKIGENYFDRLVMCSFFQDCKEKDAQVISCKMHDRVHDLAQFLAQKECLFLKMNDMEFDANKIRHVCAKDYDDSVINKAKNLRTLMIKPYSAVTNLLFDKLACLRTLDLGDRNLDELSKEVGMLSHLRYLCLWSRDMLELPETICNLYNLQSLILTDCASLCKLPDGIGNLKNLRHLEIAWTNALSYMPNGIGRLRSLRTLSKFIVGGSGGLGGCKISDLKSLNNLRGRLVLEGLGEVSDPNEATEAELKKKKNIQRLELDFGENVEEIGTEEGVLERLEPNENLECLIIRCYGGRRFPIWMENSSTVVKVELFGCKKCTELPAFEKLVSLRILRVQELGSVKSIKHESPRSNNSNEAIIFPNLRELEFEDMMEWEEWSIPFQRDGLVVIMPSLKYLRLRNCPKLKVSLLDFRKFKSLEILDLLGLNTWEGNEKNEEEEDCCSMPCLRGLTIEDCRKLKIIPHYMFPDTLRELCIENCPELKKRGIEEEDCCSMHRLKTLIIGSCRKLKVNSHYLFPSTLRGMHPCLPPHLENLVLWGDTGDFPDSLQQCSLTLRVLKFYELKHSSMPKHFNQLKALQTLEFSYCETLDLDLNELKHFTTLQSLLINDCPVLEKRLQSLGQDEWRSSILSHVPEVSIN